MAGPDLRSPDICPPDVRPKADAFAALHAGPEPLVLANVWDSCSAVLVEQAGFPALATTSAGVAFSRGYRDGERIPRDEMLAECARIAARTSLPVTADLETGYGRNPEDVAETVRLAIAAGLAGANIEDGDPTGNAPLFDFTLAVERIQAAREAADALGVSFVVNARTDGFLTGGTGAATEEESVRRANAFAAAGARSLFVPGVTDAALIGRLAAAIEGPLNVLASLKTPPLSELKALGVRRVSLGGSLARHAYSAARAALADLREHGSFGFNEGNFTNPELNRLLER